MFTIAATAPGKQTPPPAPLSRVLPHGVIVTAPNRLIALSVRVPDGVNLVVDSQQGDVNVANITGSARVAAKHGNVRITLPSYAQAAVGQGNVSVTMGSTDWPGMLHFSSDRGDIVLWVSPKAAFNVHLHTGDGTVVTDFALPATSQGRSQTIDGSVNGGERRSIDAQTSAGTVRLLRLPGT
jgi:DUF4097 and DUF4098 domain-containing protein YvlB